MSLPIASPRPSLLLSVALLLPALVQDPAPEPALDLDAPVTAYLPWFELADERAVGITIRQLLTHTSGLPDVRDYGWETPESDAGALERYVRGLKNAQLVNAPGERCSYSNMGYEVLGAVLAAVTGETFEAALKMQLLMPLGMTDSTFLRAEVPADRGAVPHVGRRAPEISAVYPYHRAHAPSSTLHSSVDEMCRWIRFNVNRGALGEQRILGAESFAALWKPCAELRPGRAMGLGWMVAESPYGPWRLQGGRDVGFRSHVTLLPEQHGGLVILSNSSETPIPALRDALMEAAFRKAG